MLARQCSSCGGMCGGGFTLKGRYYFCKQKIIKKENQVQTDYTLTNGFRVRFTGMKNLEGLEVVSNLDNPIAPPLLFNRENKKFYQSGKGCDIAFELAGVTFK